MTAYSNTSSQVRRRAMIVVVIEEWREGVGEGGFEVVEREGGG
jgi:hypothetical protein